MALDAFFPNSFGDRLTLKLSWGNYEKLSKIYVDCNKILEDTLQQVCNDYIEDTINEIDSTL